MRALPSRVVSTRLSIGSFAGVALVAAASACMQAYEPEPLPFVEEVRGPYLFAPAMMRTACAGQCDGYDSVNKTISLDLAAEDIKDANTLSAHAEKVVVFALPGVPRDIHFSGKVTTTSNGVSARRQAGCWLEGAMATGGIVDTLSLDITRGSRLRVSYLRSVPPAAGDAQLDVAPYDENTPFTEDLRARFGTTANVTATAQVLSRELTRTWYGAPSGAEQILKSASLLCGLKVDSLDSASFKGSVKISEIRVQLSYAPQSIPDVFRPGAADAGRD